MSLFLKYRTFSGVVKHREKKNQLRLLELILLCHHSNCVFSYWYGIGRAFHHYRAKRDQKEPLTKHPELDKLLREEYRSLDDFRAKEKKTVKEDGN